MGGTPCNPSNSMAVKNALCRVCPEIYAGGPCYEQNNRNNIKNALCRVSVVSLSTYDEVQTELDTWVAVDEPIVDFRTAITGIDWEEFENKNKMTFSDAREAVLELIAGKIVVGHAVWNDFQALNILHPDHMVRDTALYVPLRPGNLPPWQRENLPSLRLLAKYCLEEEIRYGCHDSRIDAATALRLYTRHREDWESRLLGGSSARIPVTQCTPLIEEALGDLPTPSRLVPDLTPQAGILSEDEEEEEEEEAIGTPERFHATRRRCRRSRKLWSLVTTYGIVPSGVLNASKTTPTKQLQDNRDDLTCQGFM